jgi:predicted transcriptional regulator
MVSKNRHTQGSDMYTAKLTEETVREILVKIYNNYYIDILQISNDYNVSDSTIYAILDGKYWKKVISSVIIELDVTLEELHDRVIKHQLIESEVIQIKKLLRETNLSNALIAKKFNMNCNTIRNIRIGNTWLHI